MSEQGTTDAQEAADVSASPSTGASDGMAASDDTAASPSTAASDGTAASEGIAASHGVPELPGGLLPRAETLNGRMGIEVLEVSPERVVASMPVEPNRQPYGLLHGGASAVLAETVGSIASAMHAATLGLAAVGIELNCTHHRSAREGTVTGTATPLHRGGSVATYAIEILDDAGRLVCTSRLTCMLISPPTSRRPDPTT